jgi:hypothetical protein
MRISLFIIAAGTSLAGARALPGWYCQNPWPQGNSFQGVKALDANTAVAVGYEGTILRTTEGGATWTHTPSGNTTLSTVFFSDANIGTVVGYEAFDCGCGSIVRTTDRGATWTRQSSGAESLTGFAVAATDASTAIVVGGPDRCGWKRRHKPPHHDRWPVAWYAKSPSANLAVADPDWRSRLAGRGLRNLENECRALDGYRSLSLKSFTMKFEPHAKGEVLTVDRVGADGRVTTDSVILYFDGQSRSLAGGMCSNHIFSPGGRTDRRDFLEVSGWHALAGTRAAEGIDPGYH